ncbi:MAG: chorismate mutase [Clostridiales bacterium]|nr:MAG: chorismate mutase [Clostridiales bacterium]
MEKDRGLYERYFWTQGTKSTKSTNKWRSCFRKRMEAVKDVAVYKKDNGLSVRDLSREAEVAKTQFKIRHGRKPETVLRRLHQKHDRRVL